MDRHVTAALVAAAAIAIGGGAVLAQSGAQDAGARASIEAANKKFMAAAAKGDAAAIASIYTSDAEAFPPNSELVRGRAAIEKLWKSTFDGMGIASVDLATTEVESQGNLAYEAGTYAMKAKDGKTLDRGKYCVVWKRTNGQWMLHRDIWSTNMPATTR